MAAYTRKDQLLLTEAYTLQLLKESIPDMSISQVHNNIDLMTEAEAEYVCVVSERIITEFWGGLKNLATGGKNAGSAGASAVGQAGSSVGQGLKNAAGAVGNFAKGVGKGAMAAGKQVVDNTKDMYNTGVVDKQAGDAIEKARTLTQQLIDLVTQAQQNGLIKAQRAITDMTLADLVDNLETAKQSAGTFSNAALGKGFTGGAGGAFKTGFQS